MYINIYIYLYLQMGQENHPHHNIPVKIYPYFETRRKITYFL
jgi:hypothetical protein